MQFLWRYIDELVGKGLEMSVIGELLLYTSASLVPMALPLAILMSSLMTFGNMGEFYELTAIKASGISLQRIMMPLFLVVFFISIAAFFFANDVMPYTNLKMRSLLYDVRKQRPEISIAPGTFYNGMDGFSIRVDKKDPKTNILYNIKIYDHTEKRGNVSVTIADSGTMIVTQDKRNLILTLYDGYSYNEMQENNQSNKPKTFPHRYDRFGERQLVIELVGFGLERTDESLFKSHYQMMSISQLSEMSDSLKIEIADKQNFLYNNLIKTTYFRKSAQEKKNKQQAIISSDSARHSRLKQALMQKQHNANLHQEARYRPDSIKAAHVGENIVDTVKADNQESTLLETPKKKQFPPNTNYFTILMVKEQSRILNDALSNARATRTYIVNTLETVEFKEEQLRRYEIEWQRKFTIAFACMVFLLIGAPFGAIIRKGGLGFPLVISTFCFIFYYIISLSGEKMVRESILKDYQGMWIAPLLFFVAGIFLTYKATTDASILNMDTYANFLKKITGKRRLSLIETLNNEQVSSDTKHLREENLLASLSSLLELINQNLENINERMKPPGFIASLVEMQGNSDLILFERLYKNICKSIIRSDLYNNKPIRLKIASLPCFSAQHYIDIDSRFYIRLILLFLPPFTLIIIIREYFLLHMLKSRFNQIYQDTEDLIYLVKKVNS
jgi:lipopolysaccharide export system permease protein